MKRYLPTHPSRAPAVNAATRATRPRDPAPRGLPAPGPARSPGAPLDRAARVALEPRFGHDFSAVRVHADPAAAGATARLGAEALTSAGHIFFAPGRYAPHTPEGRGLLAHELAHVVQQRQGTGDPRGISRPGDADEIGAHQAVAAIAAGRSPRPGPARVGLQRQTPGAPTIPLPDHLILPRQSPVETLLESFLNRMWDAQSEQQRPFRLTPKVREGLAIFFPLGAPLGAITDFPSTKIVIDHLRSRLPASLDANAAAVLDRLPSQEKKLSAASAEPGGDPATPKFPDKAAREPGAGELKPGRPPGADEAASKALLAAFEEFRKTKLGQELEKAAKSYAFSKEGIPLVILVVGSALTFVAANDPKLPSSPDVEIRPGIKLKVELSRASDVPPLLRDLFHDRTEPAPTPERKVAVSATFTFEAIGEAAIAVGHFFAEAATWIARGVVRAGTVIAKAGRTILPELAAVAGGAALGAVIGGIAGGGLGAAVGAAVGAGVGLGAALIKRAVDKP